MKKWTNITQILLLIYFFSMGKEPISVYDKWNILQATNMGANFCWTIRSLSGSIENACACQFSSWVCGNIVYLSV